MSGVDARGVYYDPYDTAIDADPYPTFARLRDEASPRGGWRSWRTSGQHAERETWLALVAVTFLGEERFGGPAVVYLPVRFAFAGLMIARGRRAAAAAAPRPA